MQFSMEAKALSIALGRVIGVVQHKSSRPILTCVLMTAEDDASLHIESTNTVISVSVHLAANVQKAGRIAVPARKFGDYLGTLPDGVIIADSRNINYMNQKAWKLLGCQATSDELVSIDDVVCLDANSCSI